MFQKISAIKNRNILLDSNIPIWYASAGFKERSGNPLRALFDNGNRLGITTISGLEILREENKEEVRKKYFNFLNFVPAVTPQVVDFQNAAVLAGEYRRVCKGKKVPFQDLVIGGVVLSNSFEKDKLLLLTTDRNDFCEPFWLTVAHQAVAADDKKTVQAHLYLLEFNVEMLDKELLPK